MGKVCSTATRETAGRKMSPLLTQELFSPFLCTALLLGVKSSPALRALSRVGHWRTERCCSGWGRLSPSPFTISSSFLSSSSSSLGCRKSLSSHARSCVSPKSPTGKKLIGPQTVWLRSAANTLHDEVGGIRAEHCCDLWRPLLQVCSRRRARGRARVIGLRTLFLLRLLLIMLVLEPPWPGSQFLSSSHLSQIMCFVILRRLRGPE